MTDEPKRRERGVIFTDTVPALLEGRKCQTRRLLKVWPEDMKPMKRRRMVALTADVELWRTDSHGAWYGVDRLATTGGLGVPVTDFIVCPYGVPGDIIYAKEAWDYFGGDEYIYQKERSAVLYRADEWLAHSGRRWRSPLFMPKWAARYRAELTDVRVQRVQEITEDDAIAEGVRELPLQEGQPGAWWSLDFSAGAALHGRDPIAAYRKAWNAIHGAGAWESNAHVWCLTFKRIGDRDGQ